MQTTGETVITRVACLAKTNNKQGDAVTAQIDPQKEEKKKKKEKRNSKLR